MKIGVTAEGAGVSTVFDFSERLSIFDIDEGFIRRLSDICLDRGIVSLRVAQLRNLEIDTLICGAISEPAAMMVYHSGIRLIAGITGSVESVVAACIEGRLNDPDYLLPGFQQQDGIDGL